MHVCVCLLSLSPAGEFLGSLVQIEEGLRKLNINEEVGWAGWLAGCKSRDPTHRGGNGSTTFCVRWDGSGTA